MLGRVFSFTNRFISFTRTLARLGEVRLWRDEAGNPRILEPLLASAKFCEGGDPGIFYALFDNFTAHTLYSGMPDTGSRAALVSLFAAASA